MHLVWLILFGISTILTFSVVKQQDIVQGYGNAVTQKGHMACAKQYDITAILMILFFSMFCATRDLVSSYDTFVYERWYNKIISIGFFTIDGVYGVLFEYISKIIGLLTGENFRAYLFVLAFVCQISVYMILKKIPKVGAYGYLMYAYLIGFYYNFAVLRAGLAIVFILLGLSYIDNSKERMYLFLFLAGLCHNTAWIILLAVVFLMFIDFDRITMLVIWMVFFINYIFGFTGVFLQKTITFLYNYVPRSMAARYELYFMNGTDERKVSLYYILYFILVLILISYSNATYQRKTVYKVVLELNVIGLAILSFFSQFNIVSRISDLFILPGLVIGLPYFFAERRKNTRNIIMGSLCLIACILYMRIFAPVVDVRFL